MKIISCINNVPIEDYSEEELKQLWIKMLAKAAEKIRMELALEWYILRINYMRYKRILETNLLGVRV